MVSLKERFGKPSTHSFLSFMSFYTFKYAYIYYRRKMKKKS
jgi:hypothetical protein